MILVVDPDGKLVTREDWEGSDLNYSIEELQPLPESEQTNTPLVSYEEVAR